jgi:endonuclease/exonuclease/phosphatase (EEP) superfamily protein YafD
LYFPDTPLIIAGDFNDVPQSGTIHGMMEQDFIDLYTLKNFEYDENSQEEGSQYRQNI